MATVLHQVTVQDAIADAVENLQKHGGHPTAREEAERIVDWFAANDPESLVDFFHEHAVAIVQSQLRVRYASTRKSHRSVFETSGVNQDGSKLPRTSPFEVIFTGAEDRRKRLGDFQRLDWLALADRHEEQLRPNLIRREFARLMAAKLPDDVTLTREVISEADVEKLEATATTRAKRILK